MLPRSAILILARIRPERGRRCAGYWVGRTVRQTREDAALREALTRYLDPNAARASSDG